MKNILSLCSLVASTLFSACSQKEELYQRRSASGAPPVSFENATPEPPVVNNKDLPALASMSLVETVDVTAMQPGFSEELSSAQKLPDGTIALFTNKKRSWLLQDGNTQNTNELKIEVPLDGTPYVLPKNNFWIFGQTSIAYPLSSSGTTDGAQVQIGRITDLEMLKTAYRVLHTGLDTIILANDKMINILTRQGDKFFVSALTLPKLNEGKATIQSAGPTTNPAAYWFAGSDQLFVLVRNEAGAYRWLASALKIELPDGTDLNPTSTFSLAMLLDITHEKNWKIEGKVALLSGAKLYTRETWKLTTSDPKPAAVAAEFTAQIKPILTDYCVSCHQGIDTQAQAMEMAAIIKPHMTNKTMPPAPMPPLTDADYTKILNWYASIPL